MNRFPRLETPPLDEVVCGISFGALEQLTPVRLGIYWNERRAQFPTTSLHAPVMDAPHIISLGPPLQRLWMESADNSLLVQLQHNRFYMNWRARGGTYPRFSTRNGQEGLLAVAMREFGLFADFVGAELGHAPTVTGCEVTKVDMLREGKHWSGLDDLNVLLPGLAGLTQQGLAQDVDDFDYRLQRSPGTASLSFRLWSQFQQDPRSVRLETRALADLSPNTAVETLMSELNQLANETFFAVVSPDALNRFQAEEASP